MQHERLGRERRFLARGEIDEHRPCEECVVRVRGDHAHADPVRRVGAGPGVDDVERVGGAELRRHLVAEAVEVLLGERLIDLAPPDAVLRATLLDEELVLRRPSGELPGVDGQRPALGQAPFPALQRVGIEQRGRRVAMDLSGGGDPVLGEVHATGQLSRGHPERLLEGFGQVGHDVAERPGGRAQRLNGTDSGIRRKGEPSSGLAEAPLMWNCVPAGMAQTKQVVRVGRRA